MTVLAPPLAPANLADPALREAVLGDLLLEGRRMHAKVADALLDLVPERSAEGATTLTMTLWDPECELLASNLFASAVDIEVGDLAFRLDGVAHSGQTLTLTFVDREVWLLQQQKSYRKASRAHSTRAEFALVLVREVKSDRIGFFCPELHQRQRVAKHDDIPKSTTRDRRRDKGFGTDSGVTVKGAPAAKAQLRILDEMLRTVESHGGSRREMIAHVMTVTQETAVTNPRGRVIWNGHTVVGPYQQDPAYWPSAGRDVAREAVAFHNAIAPALRSAGPSANLGQVIDSVQRAGTPELYEAWRDEATRTVDAWLGGRGAAGGGAGGFYVKRYLFRRGEPHKPEDSWACLLRLAREVQWRCFMDRGVVYFVSDDYLIRSRVRLRVPRTRLPDGVDGHPQFDGQSALKHDEATLSVRAGAWDIPMGAVVELVDYGQASGRYLTTNFRRSLFEEFGTVTIKRPQRALPEPASDVAQRRGSSPAAQNDVPDDFKGTHIGRAYQKAVDIDAKHYPYVWGGGHGVPEVTKHGGIGDPFQPTSPHPPLAIGYDCSGSVSAVLNAGDMMGAPAPQVSGWFETWGEPGEGKHLTVYASGVHVFIFFKVVGHLQHWGTGDWGKGWDGPGFNPNLHPTRGFVARHWPGT